MILTITSNHKLKILTVTSNYKLHENCPFILLWELTCHGELTIIQHHILQRLRNQKRSVRRKTYIKNNLNSYIQSQNENLNCYIQPKTTQKLPLFQGDIPIKDLT